MSSITVRNLDPALQEKLRIQAAERGHSIEAEALDILRSALSAPRQPRSGAELYERIRARFEPLGGVDLELPPRGQGREPPHFE